MKISVVCICVFLFCTLYWAFDTSLNFASAEDAVHSSSLSASIETTENATSNKDDSDEHNIINSDSDLEPSADIHAVIEEFANQEKKEPQYAFIETVSQNSGIAHEVAGTGPGVIHTLMDSATLELQEKAADELSSAAAAAVVTSTSHHHNETPNLGGGTETIDGKNLTGDRPSVIINSLNEAFVDKGNNLSVEIKLEQRSDKEIIKDSSNDDDNNNNNNIEQTDHTKTEVPSIEPKTNNLTKEVEEGEKREEIPSFSEWTQKQLEEAERKEQIDLSNQSQQTNGKPSSNIKKRWKNYASPDCGSKIIAANPEASSAGSVLTSSRDEYILNTCTSRIWFIVELCEAIQAKKIEVANFELFSSSPKDFSIYVSDRFPSRDWSSVGHFTAKDERNIQSFELHPHLFGKFIKFELHSHHGSEHFCPISLFRVYGTSEFEVLETENRVHTSVVEDDDDEDEEPLDSQDSNGEPPKNLFSSATDAVISMVKKAAEVLGNKANTSRDEIVNQPNDTAVKYSPLISTCTTPTHLVVCDNCSDLLFGKVYELLSCSSKQLVKLVDKPIIRKALYTSDICLNYGLEFRTSKSELSDVVAPNTYVTFINSFFTPKLVAALCNTVAVNECKVVRNISSSNATTILTSKFLTEKSLTSKTAEASLNVETIPITSEIRTVEITSEQLITTPAQINFTEASQIKPTKTLTPEEDLSLTNASATMELETVHPTESFNGQASVNDSSNVAEDKSATQQVEHVEMNSDIVNNEMETSTESSEGLDDHLDSFVKELNGDSTNIAASAATTVSPPLQPQGQKESVFLRLSNRIKALERNMSLSSQYLEELSRRYKKQVEEMQRLLDKTINTLNEENRKKDEQTQRLEDQIGSLRDAVETLIAEKNSWMHTTYWIFISGIVALGALLFCRRNPELKQSRVEDKSNSSEVQRRRSVDVITHKKPTEKKRRPSEEAMVIGGTYTDLMIDEIDSGTQKVKEKKRRKKKQLNRSNSITTLTEENIDNEDQGSRTVNSDKGFYFAPSLTSTKIWRRQESAPPNLPTDWVDDTLKHSTIHDIPFVLEESEHTSLEPLPYNSELNQKGDRPKVNGNALPGKVFTVTATDSRSKRMLQKQKNGNSNGNGNGKTDKGHKKSASVDETKRNKTPSPVTTDTISLSNNSVDSGKVLDAPKKEKRGMSFRKLFRGFNFK